MNAPTPGRLAALYAHAPAAAQSSDSPPLRERRASGAWPTVPAAGLAYSPLDVAAAFFETGADFLPIAGEPTTTDALWQTLCESVNELGPVQHATCTADFRQLDPAEFEEVGLCHRWAYRLALSLWYEGARSRPLTIGETAVALYLSTTDRHATTGTLPPAVARALRARQAAAGARLAAPDTLVRLGADLSAEFTPGAHRPGWLYRQALPDYTRRRACFHLARADRTQPVPLLVRHDGGALTVGTTPPAPAPHTWTRTLTPQW
ncbi:hypothetical protein ACWIG4_03925 [Streptomyces sp. NPDC002248]